MWYCHYPNAQYQSHSPTIAMLQPIAMPQPITELKPLIL